MPDLFGGDAGLPYAHRGLDCVALGCVSRGDNGHKETSACPRWRVRRGGYHEMDVLAAAGRNVGKLVSTCRDRRSDVGATGGSGIVFNPKTSLSAGSKGGWKRGGG